MPSLEDLPDPEIKLLSPALQGDSLPSENLLSPNWASQMALMLKNPPANTRDVGSISESGRSPGGGNGTLLQYSCLENSRTKKSVGLQSMGLQRAAWLQIVIITVNVRHVTFQWLIKYLPHCLLYNLYTGRGGRYFYPREIHCRDMYL